MLTNLHRLVMAAILIGCSADASPQCEQVRNAIEKRIVECASDWNVAGDCDLADYVEGDVQACLDAVKAATCGDLRQAVRDKCEGLFGRIAL
jgi:hypothetical protein